MPNGAVPQRLSDADRDVAVEMLRQHFAEGRLDQGEFDERLGSALTARYPDDLAVLFCDLPNPRPDAAGPAASLPVPWAAAPAPRAWAPAPVPVPVDARARTLSMVRALLWPVAIVLLITTNSFWWIFLAIIGSIILKQLEGPGRTPPPRIGG